MRDLVRIKEANVVIEERSLKDELISSQEIHNLVPDMGLAMIFHLLAGSTGYSALTSLAVGTSSVAGSTADIELGAEVYRGAITEFTFAAMTLTVKYYLPSVEANGETLTEAGLFDADNHLFARVVFTDITKTAANSVIFTWTVTFERV